LAGPWPDRLGVWAATLTLGPGAGAPRRDRYRQPVRDAGQVSGGGYRRRGEFPRGLRQERGAGSRQRRGVALRPPEEDRREARPAGRAGTGDWTRREHGPEHGASPPL